MAWTNLKAAVAAVIKTNGNQEITGALLQSTLNSIIDQIGANATFKGVAIPSTTPGVPDGPQFYIAYAPGVYSNFGGYESSGGLNILEWKDGVWGGSKIIITNGEINSTNLDPVSGGKTFEFIEKQIPRLIPTILPGWIGTKGSITQSTTRNMVEYLVDSGSSLLILIKQESDPLGLSGSVISAWNNSTFVSNIKTSTGENDYKEYIEVPEGANKIVLSLSSSLGSYGYCLPLSSPTENQSFKNIADINKRINSNNLIPFKTLDGYYLRTNGVITASATRKILYFYVSEGDQLNISISQDKNIAPLGSSGVLISIWLGDLLVNMVVTATDYTFDYQIPFTVPSGVDILKISMSNGERERVDIKGYSYLIKNNESRITEIESEINTKLTPFETVLNSFIRTNGVIDLRSGREYLRFEVQPLMRLKINVNQTTPPLGSGGSLLSTWFQGNFVQNIQSGLENQNDWELTYAIPESGVDEIRISKSSTYGSTAVVKASNSFEREDFQYLYDSFEYKPQIFNGYIPKKEIADTIEILLLGSSWGVDTIAGLSEICGNLGLNVNTGNAYKSSGSPELYLEDIINGTTNIFYYNQSSGVRTSQSLTIPQIIAYKNWDVIILQNSAETSWVKLTQEDPFFRDLIAYFRLHATNNRVIFALNSTWYDKGHPEKQILSYSVTNDLIRQTGINLLIPCGAALEYLRQSEVNDVNELFRDSIHVNIGVGRFTLAATVYQSVIYPMFGVPLDDCTFIGSIDYNGSIVETYPRIDVTNNNRLICIEAAKKANSCRFYKRGD